jgi:hypothetical protein
VYRRSFDCLAGDIGHKAAYDLLATVSFLALQTTSSEAEFVRIAKMLDDLAEAQWFRKAVVNEVCELAKRTADAKAKAKATASGAT